MKELINNRKLRRVYVYIYYEASRIGYSAYDDDASWTIAMGSGAATLFLGDYYYSWRPLRFSFSLFVRESFVAREDFPMVYEEILCGCCC